MNRFCSLLPALQLPPGGAKYVQALGKHFAVFRGEQSKKAFVTDAYCPHLGANMAANPTTRVKGDCIECPFHQWKFDGNDGACAEIPYATKASVIILKQRQLDNWAHCNFLYHNRFLPLQK